MNNQEIKYIIKQGHLYQLTSNHYKISITTVNTVKAHFWGNTHAKEDTKQTKLS